MRKKMLSFKNESLNDTEYISVDLSTDQQNLPTKRVTAEQNLPRKGVCFQPEMELGGCRLASMLRISSKS